MSADLLEDLDDDAGGFNAGGATIDLTMNAHNHAWLNITSEGDTITFHLTPTKGGLEKAERIEAAFRAWREQVIAVGLVVPNGIGGEDADTTH